MELIAPEFTGLYALPSVGDYCVEGVNPEPSQWRRRPQGQRLMSVEQHQRFIADRVLLNGLLAMEEAYDVVRGNYFDLEETVLRLSVLELTQRRPWGVEDHFDTARRSSHRALANLLSAVRAFQDQSQRLASSISGPAKAADLAALKDSLCRAYDGSLGYRFMETLRNHAQHHGVSVSGVSLSRTAPDPNQKHQFVTATPYLRLSTLRQNSKFKASVLAEAASMAEAGPWPGDPIIPVIPLVRDYMAGLSAVMIDLRELYTDRAQAALNMIYAACYHYTGYFAQSGVVGLWVASSGGPIGEVTYFGTDSHVKAERLRQVNGDLSLLPVTGVSQ
jgi:hypothetical protein